MATNRPGKKTLDKVEEEIINEGIGFYRRFRQKTLNGVMPVGIAAVGKTTLLSQLDAAGPSLFADFNRTLRTKVTTPRLRKELLEACEKTRFTRKIDVPGELPEEWAEAYFDNNPRILAMIVDGRTTAELSSFKQFLAKVNEGPSLWQKTKTAAMFRWNNLSRIFFIINKIDLLDNKTVRDIQNNYRDILAEMHSQFGVNIQTFQVSLQSEEKKLGELINQQHDLFFAMVDALESD